MWHQNVLYSMGKKFLSLLNLALLFFSILLMSTPNTDVVAQSDSEERVLRGAIDFIFPETSEWRNQHSYAEDELVSLLHAGLYHRSITNNKDWTPFLAEDYPEVSSNGLQWTVKLRENLYFPNGDHLTAEDVVFTYNVALTPNINNESGSYIKFASVFNSNSSIVEVNDFTVQFNFKEIHRYQFELLSHTIIEKNVFSNMYSSCVSGIIADCFWSDSTGMFFQNAGPFQVDTLSPTEVSVVRNPNYFNSSNLKADKIIIKAIEDKATALEMLSNGELDFLSEGFSVNDTDLENLDEFSSELYSQARTEFAQINHIHHVFGTGEEIPNGTGLSDNNDIQAKWVRKAMSTVLDRQYIVDTFYSGLATIARSTIPESAVNFNTNLQPPVYSFDLAKEYMENAGYNYSTITDANGDGDYGDENDKAFFNLTIMVYGSSPQRLGWSNYYTNELTKIGINATIVNVDASFFNIFQVGELVPLEKDGGYDLFVINFGQFDFEWDAMEFYTSETLCNSEASINAGYCLGNVINYQNPVIDSLAGQFQNELNQTLRTEIAYEFQEIMQDEVVELYIINTAHYVIKDSEIKNFEFRMHEFGFHEWHRVYKTSWPPVIDTEKSDEFKIPLMLQWLIPALFILLVVRKRIIFA